MKNKGKIWIVLYSAVLAAFTVYFLLDTFVITRVYSAETGSANTALQSATEDQSQLQSGNTASGSEESGSTTARSKRSKKNSSGSSSSSGSQQAIAKTVSPDVMENSYTDENICISITEYDVSDSVVYVADVQLKSADYLKTALAQGAYGRNVTDETSGIAQGVGAILAINGDYYGSQEKGYVIRNGVLYRSTAVSGRQDLVIYKDGSFEIITEGEVSAEELLANGAMQVLSFGPGIVENGKVSVSSSYEVAKAMNSNPRTAIGIIDDLHYVFVVSDGRTSESEGLSVYQLAQFMQSLGVQTAYNLDGGGSSTMYFNGNIVNNPTTNGRTIKERSVSDIVYIGY